MRAFICQRSEHRGVIKCPDNGPVNGAEKIEAEGKGDANFNAVRIRVCVPILHIQPVAGLRVDRLINVTLTMNVRSIN